MTTIPASVDGYARDANRDNVYTVLDTAGSNLLVRWTTGTNVGSEKSLIEFDLTNISTALSVNSATLVLNVSQFTRDGIKFPRIDVVGYTGDGAISLTDGSVAGTVIGTSTINARGELRIDLNTDFIRSQGGGFLGIRLENAVLNGPYGIFSALESTLPEPRLELDLSLNIPTKEFNVDEQRPNGTFVGDAGVGNNANYTVVNGDPGGVFNVNPLTGRITVADSSQLQFAIEDQYVLTIEASLPDGSVGQYDVIINVKNVFGPNNPPVVTPSQFTIEEFAANGTFVGKVPAVDPDAADPLSFSIVAGNVNNAFAINPLTGEITVANQAALNRRDQTSFVLAVQVRDTRLPRHSVVQNMQVFLTPRVMAIPDPNVVQILPVIDAERRDLDNNGTFESMNATANVMRIENAAVERRAIMEFDLSGFSPGKIVKSAYLTVHVGSNTGNVIPINVFGYAGDGVITQNDAVAGIKIGSRTFNITSSQDRKSYTIELDRALIQQLLGTTTDLGIVLRNDVNSNAIEIDTTEGPVNLGNALSRRPTLNLVLEDPADDVVFNDPTTKKMTVARSTGSAFNSFAAGALRQGVNFSELLTGDFNGDGRLDVAGRNAANGQILVALASANQFVTGAAWTTFSKATTFSDVIVADFNGDGRDDIAARSAQGQLLVATSTGTKFTNVVFETLPQQLRSLTNVRAGDFNGDGRADLMGIVSTTGQVVVSISNGSSFTSSVWGTVPVGSTTEVHVGDFNGDGRDDIFTRQGLSDLVVLRSTGSSFSTTPFGTLPVGVQFAGFRLGDFNGDGLDDVVGFTAAGALTLFRSTGGSFVLPPNVGSLPVPVTNVTPSDIVIGDFNRDGKSDILVRQGQQLYVSLGSSLGPFTSSLFGTLNTNNSLTLLGVGNY